MPKMKTHKGAAKRFRVTKNGKLMSRRARSSHINRKLRRSYVKRGTRPATIAKESAKKIRTLIGRS